MESVRGKLLVASPVLVDPNFARTVVLVAAHDADGALGLVLNRPSTLTVSEVVAQLTGACRAFEQIYVGGPVQPGAVIVLAEFSDRSLGSMMIDGDLGIPHVALDPAALAGGVRRARAFAGHAGWGAGQLDAELAEEAWIVADLEPEDSWTNPGGRLWSTVLERKGGEYALLARMPVDPTVN
ncbi:MAG TPA: YqgE/AlgH family protein [Solirubrobacteraceae bacterium]|jgi:putative transcriptional regulator|nr:YqgE/AlgH family protein [Solirubrobacteraceae bacterium]